MENSRTSLKYALECVSAQCAWSLIMRASTLPVAVGSHRAGYSQDRLRGADAAGVGATGASVMRRETVGPVGF